MQLAQDTAGLFQDRVRVARDELDGKEEAVYEPDVLVVMDVSIEELERLARLK